MVESGGGRDHRGHPHLCSRDDDDGDDDDDDDGVTEAGMVTCCW